MYKIDRRRIHLKREKKKNPTKTPGANQWRTTESSEAYLENILSRCEFRYIHPLAIDVVLVHVATVHGDTLVTVVGAFVPEITQSSVAPVNWLVNQSQWSSCVNDLEREGKTERKKQKKKREKRKEGKMIFFSFSFG